MQHGLLAGGHVADLFFADKRDARDLLKEARSYDTVIICKGNQIRNLDRYLEVVRNLPDTTYFIPDVVDRGNRASSVGPRALACTRIVCTGTEAAKWFRSQRYRGRVAQVYQGFRSHIWKPGDSLPQNQNRIAFLGAFYGDDGGRENRLAGLRNLGFDVFHRDDIFHEQAASTYWNSALCLNFSAWDCTSNRAVRVMASGGFLLTELNRDVAATFERGNQLDWFSSPKEMEEKVIFYMKNPKIRMEIAKRGYTWTKDRSWTEQMEKIVRFVQGEDFCDGAADPYTGEAPDYPEPEPMRTTKPKKQTTKSKKHNPVAAKSSPGTRRYGKGGALQ